MDPTDAHEDKENRGAVRPATAGGNGTSRLLQPTASSKQRFGAPDPLAAPPGLRANLNGSTFMHGAGSRPSTARGDFASGAPPAAPRPAPSSPPGRATAGVADLSSFRARLNVVKRESMMRQSMIMPHQQDAAHPSSSASMAPIAETASVSSHRGAPDPAPSSAALSLDPFAARDAFASYGDPGGASALRGGVQESNRACFDDPEFVESLERCLHWRPKALKGFDMKAVKVEARDTINALKQCLQQALVRKERMVEDLARLERDRDQAAEGLKLQMESATASASAAERELAALRTQMASRSASAASEAEELRAARDEALAEARRLRESADWDRRRLEDDYEARGTELANLKRRHEENQESLRATRADLAQVRESLARAEREAAALRRDRENGESAYGAERKALEAQIRAKIDEAASERAERSRQRQQFDEKLREANAEVEKLSVQNKLLKSSAEEAEEGKRSTRSSLSAKLAEAETELESLQRERTRERARREERERELCASLAAAEKKADDHEAKLAVVAAENSSLKQKLAAALNGAEDAAAEAKDAAGEKDAELARVGARVASLEAEALERDAAFAELEATLAEARRAAEEAAEEQRAEREAREGTFEALKSRLETDLDAARREASECKGRADALLAQQATLMADIKEERQRAGKMEEERKAALEGGASAAELARREAREDIRAAEERHSRDKEEMAAEKSAAIAAAEARAEAEVAAVREKLEEKLAALEAETSAAKDAALKAAAEGEARTSAAEDAAEKARAELEATLAEREAAAASRLAEVEAARDASLEAARVAAAEKATEATEALAALEARLAEKEAEADATREAGEAERAALAAELERVGKELASTRSTLDALESANAARASEASEAEKAREELAAQAASAERRVADVVAQLELERAEVDRLEAEAKSAEKAREAAAKALEEKAAADRAERADLTAELKALRAAAGIGDDGEELEEAEEDAEEKSHPSRQADMSARDATALTSRLVKATKAAEAARRVASDMETYKKIAEERERRIEELERQALDAEATRRALHNQIQELRGNVRVFCRVRPTTSDSACVECPADGSSVALTKPDAAGNVPACFEFDRVFGPDSTQGEVFEEVSQLVQSALDGYKVCLFSYGQTGSGKTHTMLGDHSSSENRGVIPRAVAAVVEASERNAKKGWTYEMRASYVEIYNEQVRDLLKLGSGHSDKHAIVHSPSGVTEVSGVQCEPVASVEAAHALVRRAANARAVEATQMNAQSSRSHTVFMLYVVGRHAASGSTLSGCLNLVDLAGSERVGRSGAEGARLKEACAINKSLSCLGDVFQALSNKRAHVPYRNSKLTYLLQPCLGGDGKTLMFVNINPEAPSAEESLCSLKFAAQVNAVELGGGRGGGAKRNVVSGMSAKAAADEKSAAERDDDDDKKEDEKRAAANTHSKRPKSAKAAESGRGKPPASAPAPARAKREQRPMSAKPSSGAGADPAPETRNALKKKRPETARPAGREKDAERGAKKPKRG